MRAALIAREDGFTIVELAIAAMLSLVVLVLVTGTMIVAYRTTNFTQGQSFTLDDARTALQQVQRDIQNASYIDWCGNDGGCLDLVTWSPTEETRVVRYQVTGSELSRALFDADGAAFGAPIPVLDRLANGTGQPVFDCDLQTSLLRVNVDFIIQPSPHTSPTYNLHTSVRPRNFPSTANCP